MKISFNWLAEFVDIRDIDPAEVGHKLTMSTSEIEGIEEAGDDLERVVVGKIIDVKQHPQADKLFLTKIDVGNEVLDIISGAPNTKKGTHVPVALIGARLPGGTRVKKAKLRGMESNGIVCSERELGVSDDHTGLWILDDEAVMPGQLIPGTRVASIFPTRDYIIEIDNKSVTNRPDLWGHYGFARELAAIFGRKLDPVYTSEQIEEVTRAGGNDRVEIVIADKDLCPRYTAIMLGGVTVKKSSYIVRRRLYTLGVRPIYNIVDVTNYVM
ncbi:MAG TPA: phenylalanine--tRNA ligase subunit beta, partial [Spirochaetes bacterium]|nr:phenylalanine--tRNA ligase subunit beta [Spirochaetota bacterium]